MNIKLTITTLKNLFKENAGIILLLLIFIIIYSFNLDKYPSLWTDEAWFSNPAFTLVTQGFLGTTMLPSFYDINHFTYWQPPIYLLLLAFSFKLFGFGIIQARIVSVILGFFTVLFTYLLGNELYSKKIGLIASLLLVSNPLFFFVSRDARMDIAVACFTLIALYFLLIALRKSKHIYYFYSGLFAMLSLFSHPNGLFGIISIVLIYCMCKIDFKNFKLKFKLKEMLYLILGPILLVIPYLYYVSLNFPAFKSQFKSNILNSTNGLLSNIFSETTRYLWSFDFFKNIDGWILITILLIISIYLTLFGLLYIIKNKSKFSSKFLVIILSVHLILFTVIVSQKYAIWYFGIILPYWSILIALSFKGKFNYKKIIQTLIIALLIINILINAFGILNIFLTTKDLNPQAIQPEVQKYIPNGSIVVGDTAYWFTLHDNYTYYDYNNMNISNFKKLKIKYVLYDNYWATNQSTTKTKEFLNNNCTLIAEIPKNPSIRLSPIEIYKINK